MRSPWSALRIGGLAILWVNGFVWTVLVLLNIEATGAELLEIPAEVCERVAAQYQQHDTGRAPAEGTAYLRQLDRIDAGFQAQGTVAK